MALHIVFDNWVSLESSAIKGKAAEKSNFCYNFSDMEGDYMGIETIIYHFELTVNYFYDIE